MDKDNIPSAPNAQRPSPKDFYREVFRTFPKTGASTLDGGYAMTSIIQSEVVVKRGWIPEDQFVDLVVVVQSCPGVLVANISISVGYKIRKTLGAFVTCLGAILPSFFIILCIALSFHQLAGIPWVAAILCGIRPVVVALVAAPTFTLAKGAKLSLANCWILTVTTIAIWPLGVNPVYVIIATGLGGFLYGRFIKSTE